MESSNQKCDLSSNNDSINIVWLIGCTVIAWFLFKILRSIWRGLYSCFLADLFGATVNWKKLGKWAGKEKYCF